MGKRRPKRVASSQSEAVAASDPRQNELLIMRKIAELEHSQSAHSSMGSEYQSLLEQIDRSYDESELCREFDSEIIDESKSPEERVQHVRALFMEKVRRAETLYDGCKAIDQRCRTLLSANMKLSTRLNALTHEYEGALRKQELLQEMARVRRLQNKQIKEEMENFEQREGERIQTMTDKFHKTLEDITQKLAEQEGEQKTQNEQNTELREKLEQFQERFNLQEQHYSTQLQTKDLEVQLMEAKCQQQENIFAQEKAKADAYRAHISQLSATEKELNSQLALYASKFEHFQEALSRSNEMFKQFKEKMDRMAETIETLTAQNKQLRGAAQQTDIALIRTLEEKQGLAKQLTQLTSAQDRLTARCQQLQTERTQLKREVQAAQDTLDRIARSQLPVAAEPAPEASPSETAVP